MRQRWQANLQALKEELLRRMPMPVREQGGGRYCALAAEVATCRGAACALHCPLVSVGPCLSSLSSRTLGVLSQGGRPGCGDAACPDLGRGL